jgi:hypothetical protein
MVARGGTIVIYAKNAAAKVGYEDALILNERCRGRTENTWSEEGTLNV